MSLIDTWWLEQTETDVPTEDDWLSPSEANLLAGFHVPKRRADWRLGRWTAKHAVAMHLSCGDDRPALRAIEIRPARSGAPEIFIRDAPMRLPISLSHRDGVAMCALAPPCAELGCDLESIEKHSDDFVHDYFTSEEQRVIARTQSEEEKVLTVALIWSAKECVLKALTTGLRADTRSVSVTIAHQPITLSEWQRFSVRTRECRLFHGWWQRSQQRVRTLVVAPPSGQPIALSPLPQGTAHPGATRKSTPR
jgi:4'-phosphopantetheinyl transferase